VKNALSTFVLITSWMIASFLTSCNRAHSHSRPDKQGGLFVTTQLPLQEYVKTQLANNGKGKERFYFPSLQIYNESGQLIYTSHDQRANAELFSEAPDGLKQLKAMPNTELLEKATFELHSFDQTRQDLVRSRQFTLVSMDLADCEGCSMQEEVIARNRDKLRDRGVNVLVVHIARPKGN